MNYAMRSWTLLFFVPAVTGLAVVTRPAAAGPAPAAGIQQLADTYEGDAYSSRDDSTEEFGIVLTVFATTGSRFSGELTVETEEGPLVIPCTGNVSRSGRFSAKGNLTDGKTRVQVILTAQLSATGRALVGTYRASGRDDGGSFTDNGTFAILRPEIE